MYEYIFKNHHVSHYVYGLVLCLPGSLVHTTMASPIEVNIIPSLAHLSVLSIPCHAPLTDRQSMVLKNIKYDSSSRFDAAMVHGREIYTKFSTARHVYSREIKHGDNRIEADTSEMCDELFNLYDRTVELRNEMSHFNMWSVAFVYMDWIISKVLCAPHAEVEELYHTLSGCTSMWNKISPVFKIETYTSGELELHGCIMNFKNAAFRMFATLERGVIKGIDDFMKISESVIDLSTQMDYNDRYKMFLKKITMHLERHVSEFKCGEILLDETELEDGEIALDTW